MNVIDKIKALRRLSQNRSATPAEAASAAARIQELLLKHKLNESELGDDNDGIEWWPDPIWVGLRRSPWRTSLATGIAAANACRILHGTTNGGIRRMTVVGKKSDAEAVRYLYTYLERELERHCKKHLEKTSRDQTSAHLRASSFRLGFADTISRRLREQQASMCAAAESQGMHTGLVRIQRDEDAVQKWVAEKGLQVSKQKVFTIDAGSWRKGCENGATIDIRRAIGG